MIIKIILIMKLKILLSPKNKMIMKMMIHVKSTTTTIQTYTITTKRITI